MEDKYGLKKTFQNLEDDAKEEVRAALKRAEEKLTFGTIISHWREIVILALLVAGVFFWQRWQSTQKELTTKQETFDRLQKIDAIDDKLKQVEQHQQETIPKIDQTVMQIEAARSQINKLEKKIKTPSQAQFQSEAKKQTPEELSKSFSDMGYPNEVRNK